MTCGHDLKPILLLNYCLIDPILVTRINNRQPHCEEGLREYLCNSFIQQHKGLYDILTIMRIREAQ